MPLVLLSVALLALQAPTVTLSPQEGDKRTYVSNLNLSSNGVEAVVEAETTQVFSKVTDADFFVEETTVVKHMTVNGNDATPPASVVPYAKATVARDGTVKSLECSDVPLSHLLFRFVPAPAEEGKTTTMTLKGDGRDLSDQTVETVYKGMKGGGFAYAQKTTVDGGTIETDYMVRADGTVLEASTKFSNLLNAFDKTRFEGTGTLKLKP